MKSFLTALLLAPLMLLHAAAVSPSSKPNIIFILADDLGVGNVSCYGADNYPTPHIDQRAPGGIRFTHGYTAPLCGPSRALIRTGRYAFRTGATNQVGIGRTQNTVETMLPKYLKAVGHVRPAIGKRGQKTEAVATTPSRSPHPILAVTMQSERGLPARSGRPHDGKGGLAERVLGSLNSEPTAWNPFNASDGSPLEPAGSRRSFRRNSYGLL